MTTQEESNLIFDSKDVLGIDNYFWIGIKKTGGIWNWDRSGKAGWTNWSTGSGNCVYVTKNTLTWRKSHCGASHYILCEFEP